LYDENGNKVKAEGVDGKDANSAFTSYVFTRNQNIPNKPQGGSYSNPLPNNDSII
jgi:hypothetical protein